MSTQLSFLFSFIFSHHHFVFPCFAFYTIKSFLKLRIKLQLNDSLHCLKIILNELINKYGFRKKEYRIFFKNLIN